MIPTFSIVDYFSGNGVSLGVVTKAGEERFTVQLVSGKTDKVTPRQVIATHGMARDGDTSALNDVQTRIDQARAEIDMALLLEDLQAQGRLDASLQDICQNYFGNTAAENLGAMARAMNDDTLHFKRTSTGIAMRTADEIAKLERLRKMRAEKAAVRERTLNWLNDTVLVALNKTDESDATAGTVEIPEEQTAFIKQLQDYLLLGRNSDAVSLLGHLPFKLNARALAIHILHRTGSFPPDADEFLLANGIHAGFAPETMQAASDLPPYTPDALRKDLTGELVFSIDDAETRDIDDALSCSVDDDGNTVVHIFIADPAAFVLKNSPLDNAAVDRPLSLYLPTTTVPMFPTILSYDHASLVQGVVRPAMAFTATLDEEGDIIDWGLASAQVNVTHRLTYDEADQMILHDETPLAKALRRLRAAARHRYAIRAEDGAISLNRPDVKIRVVNGDISVKRQETNTPSHLIVGEMMILANYLAARYALINDIPIIYRAQEHPSEPVSSVVPYDPYEFDLQVRKMRRSTLSTYPAAHFGLGLDLYTQASSPLRRYADLVIQRQLSAHLRGLPVPYTQEELFVILENVDRTAAQNKALEREANTYWMLEYIRRNLLGTTHKATVVRHEGALTLAELDEFVIRGVVYTRDRLRPGEHITVRIKDALPDAARLILESL